MNTYPKFQSIEQVSDGWIKKYILTYQKPDGTLYTYESASRKSLAEYQAELERNGAAVSANDSLTTNSSFASDNTSNCDAVCIVPELPDGSYLMIKEFRYPINGVFAAFPAGLIDEGETIEETVDRELREETGYRLRTDVDTPVQPLVQPGYSSVGMTDESVLVVFAKVEKYGEASPEPNELIEPFILPKDEIRAFINSASYLLGTRAQLILEILALRSGS